MYQTSTYILRLASKEEAKAAMVLIKPLVAGIDDWGRRLMVCGSDLTVGEDCYITEADYRGLAVRLCKALAQKGSWEFLCYAEHLSDVGETREYIRFRGGLLQSYAVREDYALGTRQETVGEGFVTGGRLSWEEQAADTLPQELRCGYCGEFYSCSEVSPVSRCPFCGELEEQQPAEPVQDTDPGWKSYDFEIPLGICFPEEKISAGMDWLEDCEENETFGLEPACFPNKNQYDAALKLCKICGGWYGFDTEEERLEWVELLRAVLRAKPGEPMWYYDVWQQSFHWIGALRDNNPRYAGQFAEVDSLWELFSRLQQRSILEKADCFGWFVEFFGPCLVHDHRRSLPDCYVQNYDNHLEMILYLRPEQMSLLTEGASAVTTAGAGHLARAAAGLIRLGRRAEGISMYEKVFRLVWENRSTADEKKSVMDAFLSRLEAGYENTPYLDGELTGLLEDQCKKYSDAKWTAKIRMMLGKS